MLAWGENKRQANLIKHKLDFADAGLVFDNPEKLTLRSRREGEDRYVDIAIVQIFGLCLALVYVHRDEETRIISFRIASRQERQLFGQRSQPV